MVEDKQFVLEYRKLIGEPSDIRCRANMTKMITPKVCKNNCAFYRGYCMFGYDNKSKRK